MTRERHRIRVIDSHTGGEPTRLIVTGGPDLGTGSLADRLECFRTKHDGFRSAVVNEPRGSDVMVGGLLSDPLDPTCASSTQNRVPRQTVIRGNLCNAGCLGFVTRRLKT